VFLVVQTRNMPVYPHSKDLVLAEPALGTAADFFRGSCATV